MVSSQDILNNLSRCIDKDLSPHPSLLKAIRHELYEREVRIERLESDYQRLFGALAEIIDATDDRFGALDNVYAIARKALGVSDG